MAQYIKLVSQSSVLKIIYTRSISYVDCEDDNFIIHTAGGTISLRDYMPCEIQLINTTNTSANKAISYDGTSVSKDYVRSLFLADII